MLRNARARGMGTRRSREVQQEDNVEQKVYGGVKGIEEEVRVELQEENGR